MRQRKLSLYEHAIEQSVSDALCRVTYRAPAQNDVFLMVESPDGAYTGATVVLSALNGIATKDVRLYNLASFRKLLDIGVSDDEDLRIFERG